MIVPVSHKHHFLSMKKLTTEEFIKQAKEVHGDKYDYSKVSYVNAHTQISIICPEHGEFKQEPRAHTLQKQGCPKCSNRFELDRDAVKDLKKVHGDKYDYSKVKYVNPRDKIIIVCPKHGTFEQRFDAHLSGQGCPICKAEKIKEIKSLTTEEFTEKAKKVHENEYDYSKVEYINSHKNIKIICKIHGIFEQTPNSHLNGHGCPKCNSSKLEKSLRNYLEEKNIRYEEQKTFEWLKCKSYMYLDFYLPEHNIAIECQGGQHFIPVDYAGLGKEWATKQLIIIQSRDKLKKELCESNGIKMMYYTEENKENFNII